jgi:hypothetical protein
MAARGIGAGRTHANKSHANISTVVVCLNSGATEMSTEKETPQPGARQRKKIPQLRDYDFKCISCQGILANFGNGDVKCFGYFLRFAFSHLTVS